MAMGQSAATTVPRAQQGTSVIRGTGDPERLWCLFGGSASHAYFSPKKGTRDGVAAPSRSSLEETSLPSPPPQGTSALW